MKLNTLDIEVQQTEIVVKGVRLLTDSTYILELQRNNMIYKAGQYICLGIPEINQVREYSIYSGETEDNLEVLIKEVDEGLISQKLKECKAGQKIRFDGPFGTYTLKQGDIGTKKFFFIATGTGIAPFHSFIKSYSNLHYKLLHGVRELDEAYEKKHYRKENYVLCTSRDNRGDFEGRVTDYLRQNPPTEQYEYYLCGNGKMIYEAVEILRTQNVPDERIHFEIYF